MRIARRLSSILAPLLLISLACLLRGCLQAEETDFIRYDPERDEFHALMIQRGITGSGQGDLDYLKVFFENRDHLLMPLIPSVVPLLDIRLLRLSDRTFAVTAFSNAPSDLDPHDSPVSLNQITITPGTFFAEANTLCYYHALTVPGKIIDGALEQISIAAQNDQLLTPLNDELARRQQGGLRHNWEEFTAQTIHALDGSAPPATAPADDATSQPADATSSPLACLDDESLQHLSSAITDKSLRIQRDGPIFSTTLPLSSADSEAVVAVSRAITKRLHTIAAVRPDAQELQMQNAVASAVTITSGRDGITIAVNPVILSRLMSKMNSLPIFTNNESSPTPGTPPSDALQFVRNQKLPLDETLTSKQLLTDFNADKLPAHPSTPPVVPGAGMVSQ